MTDSTKILLDSIATLQTQLAQAHDTIATDTQSIGIIRSYVSRLAHDGGFDLWDWLAIIIALVSLGVAGVMAYWQYKTERNTKRITKGSQIKLMIDNIRHLYANLVIINAMQMKLANRYATHYPSQDHFRKLAIDIQAIHPEGFINDTKKIESIHRSRLLIRNYNIEVTVAEQHICSEKFPPELKPRDFGILIMKQNLFLNEFLHQLQNIAGNQYPKYLEDIRKCIIEEAMFRTNKRDFSYDRESILQIIGCTAKYYDSESSAFARLLFNDDTELFDAIINYNIDYEINSLNYTAYQRIFIIPFESEQKNIQ